MKGPLADMSKQLGGMRLGMTIDDFVYACRDAGKAAAKVDDLALMCSGAPVPLAFAGKPVDLSGQVGAVFCGPDATACELMYFVDGDIAHTDDQAVALLSALEDKYGPPMATEGYSGRDPMRECIRSSAVHWKRTWVFGPKQVPSHPVGWARIVFDCDLRGMKRERSLALFYDDEWGFRYRSDERKQRQENF